MMIFNLSDVASRSAINYPIYDSSLPFADYITRSRAIITERRPDLHRPGINAELIIDSNCPYELVPGQPILSGKRIKYGVLLIHGLLDCPFTLRDLGGQLQANGMLCRSILLPGHGTTPSDLLNISYHDWIQALHYGIESFKSEVEKLYIVGYSTGATLAIYQALQDPQLAGIVLLAPAVRIKAPTDMLAGWHYLMQWLHENKQWIYSFPEVDYAKYQSIAFNPVRQVAQLTNVIEELRQQAQHPLDCPVYMAISREDETISSEKALSFFSSLQNQESKCLLYSGRHYNSADPRITTRITNYPDLNIRHFSHVALPFAPDNPHYGQHGDYEFAAHIGQANTVYGAYNKIEAKSYDILQRLNLIKNQHRMLTYNPDFAFLAQQICEFILS